MQAVSQLTKIEFSKVKIVFDVSMVLISLTTCLFFTHSPGSVGIGTIIAAVLVGTILGQLNRGFGGWRDRLLETQNADEMTETPQESNENHYVITISREYGSGGREIGKLLAAELQIPFYDLDIIRSVAQKSGYSEDYVTRNEQKIANPALRNLYYWYTAAASEEDLPKIEQLYDAQKKVIREIAAKESCVIVGRLANFILKDCHYAFHVFISADMDAKIERVTIRDHIDKDVAKKQITKVEKERANHCYYFTHHHWGSARYYDLMIKSNILGIPNAAKLIGDLAKTSLPKK
jgi:cytidylate kinase